MSKKNIKISISHHICPIFHAENNLSKLKFNFAHFIGPILTLRGPAPFHASTGILSNWAGEYFGDQQSTNRGIDPVVTLLNRNGTNFDAPEAHFDK
jgi:hypothetical protein